MNEKQSRWIIYKYEPKLSHQFIHLSPGKKKKGLSFKKTIIINSIEEISQISEDIEIFKKMPAFKVQKGSAILGISNKCYKRKSITKELSKKFSVPISFCINK